MLSIKTTNLHQAVLFQGFQIMIKTADIGDTFISPYFKGKGDNLIL